METEVLIPLKERKTKRVENEISPEKMEIAPVSGEYSLSDFFNGLVKIAHYFSKNALENFSGYVHDNRDIALTYTSLFSEIMANPAEISKVQQLFLDYVQEQQILWNNIYLNQEAGTYEGEEINSKENSSPKKKKAKIEAEGFWEKNSYFDFLKRSHLLQEKLARRIVDEVEIGSTKRKKLSFYTNQYVSLFSPDNFLLTNPEALDLTFKTQGKNLWKGFLNFVRDVEHGRISQVDQTAFEVGENLAISPGDVIYENDLMQLIQYKPSTEFVKEVPLLMIPPWINKYYIMDLQPDKSLVKYMVDEGHTVYMISWKNPDIGMGYFSFDDYVDLGALKAIEVANAISGSEKINVLGYCLGGTLMGVTAAILAARKSKVINSLTFLASMLEFSHIGPMGDVINDALVKKLERGELLKGGVMHGHDMERAFNLIRVNDLVWKYVIANYLKGEPPDKFDVMYWTNDNTNLPSRMYIYYMREMIFNNKLAQKNALRICDTPIDIGKISAPVFLIALERDYISPPETVYLNSNLVSGPVDLILGESGHVMGAMNPPSKNKYGYYINGKLGRGLEEWKNTATFHQGSWWTYWKGKLNDLSGKKVPAPKSPGNDEYQSIEPAPGHYVKERCELCFADVLKKDEEILK